MQYQGRTLHFTEDYLSSLEKAFRSGAYDQVSFQLADARNAHTNDPERHRGFITDLELGEDGLYATAQVTEAGERVLAENPMLGVSARIVENYARSDGAYFPAAIQHVLGTLDPRIPALGAWAPVDMANGGQMVVDLTNSVWLGEPAAPDTQLSDRELGEWLEAVAEADAEEALNSGYGYDQEAASALSDFDATFQHQAAAGAAREQARQAADMDDLISPARRDEDVLSRALARLSSGIYSTDHAASFASPSTDAIELSSDLTMATGKGLCGPADAFGRCSSPQHQMGCVHDVSTDWMAIEDGPPRSTYALALSNFAAEHDTGPAPASYGDGDEQHPIPQRTLDFAHALNQSWGMHAVTPAPTADDLLGASWGARRDAYAAMASELGRPDLAAEPQLPGDGYPDVSELARQMGLK